MTVMRDATPYPWQSPRSHRHYRRVCRHGIVVSTCRCVNAKTDVIVACGRRCADANALDNDYVPKHALNDDPADDVTADDATAECDAA